MAEKKIQTRIRHKVDTKANWDKATNFVPLKGEIIIYSDLNQAKIGDGTTKVGALPFLKGKADASDKNPTLAWGSKSTVATVDGVDIHVTMPSNPNTHQSIKTLNTNNTAAQTVSANEAIAGSGTINLHKVAKTGSYNDLNNKPTIPTVPSNIVKYTNHTVEVAGTNKTVAAVSPSALYVANGLIMGGTAAAAGLVTRGICGVTTPDSTTGACTKENLYLNYDGDNNYSRKVVLGAGSPGDSIAGGATTFSAVRGDQMVGYVNSLALIKSGKQTTTSTSDVGTNVYTFTDTKGATSTFTVKNGSKGSNGHDGTAAGFGTPTASVDANVGTPSVTITSSGPDTAKVFNFAFKNLKGETGGQGPEGPRGPQGPAGGTGPQGPGGAAAGFGSVTATIDAGVGTPSVTVSTSGDNTKKNFAFAFKNLKGATGAHISSVTGDKTPAAGNTVTYTMKNTDGSTAGTFKVVNGTNGSDGGVGPQGPAGPAGGVGPQGPAGSVASFKAGSGSGNVITGLTLNSDKSVTYDKAVNALDKGSASTNDNQVVYNPVELKKGLIGNGSFTLTNTEKGKPLDIRFVATTDQSGVDIMGFNATDTLATLTGSAYMGNTKFTLQSGYSDGAGPSIVIDNNGYKTTITADGINPGDNGQIQWPTSGGRFVTSGDFANENATDLSVNQGKIPTLEYQGTIPSKFIKPMVSMYASESDLPGAIHFSPFYVPDALYVTKDTNSIYRYNQDTESYIKLGPDIRSEQWKLTSTSGTVTTINICTK